MKTSHLFSAALLGFATSFSAHAQTPVLGSPGTMSTPGSPATSATGTAIIAPGQLSNTVPGTLNTGALGTGTVSPNATTPLGTSGTMAPNGTLNRNVDGGTLRSDQPMGSPTTPGSQPARRLNNRTRTSTSTTNTNTTTRP